MHASNNCFEYNIHACSKRYLLPTHNHAMRLFISTLSILMSLCGVQTVLLTQTAHHVYVCTCMYSHDVCTFVGCCLATEVSIGSYLAAEVVEEVMGWLGLVGMATANKIVAQQELGCIRPCSSCIPILVMQLICMFSHDLQCACAHMMYMYVRAQETYMCSQSIGAPLAYPLMQG